MNLKKVAKEIRKDILFQVYTAQSGHIGGALSCADILTAIYFELLSDGDKVILSKGHASAALYAIFAECGKIEKNELATFRKINSRLQGHPSTGSLESVDVSSGSLGQGLSIANGIALGFKLDKLENFVYVILGDGEIQEGQVWEALMTGSHYKLNNVIAFLDYNKLQIDGANKDVMNIEPLKDKFKSFGWFVQEINGHNYGQITGAVNRAKKQSKPSIMIANTIKGKGVSFMENNISWHGKSPKEEEYKQAMSEL